MYKDIVIILNINIFFARTYKHDELKTPTLENNTTTNAKEIQLFYLSNCLTPRRYNKRRKGLLVTNSRV